MDSPVRTLIQWGTHMVLCMAVSFPAQSSEPTPAEEVVPGEGRGEVRRVVSGGLVFRYDGATASSVALHGSWDGWQPHSLESLTDGTWAIEIAVPDGDHAYRYVVDDLPALDPVNPRADLGPDGGLVSLISVVHDFDGLESAPPMGPLAEEVVPIEDALPLLGPMEVGVRYHGRIDGDASPSRLPVSRHALDLPLHAGLANRGQFNALLVSESDDASGELELFRLRSSARVGRSRIQVTHNAPLASGGTFALLQPMGRHDYPVGLDGDGVSAGVRLGGQRADALHLVRDAGLLGPASRLSAGSVSGRIHDLRWQCSFVRESDRDQRFVDSAGRAVIPVVGDTVTVQERRSQAWQASALFSSGAVEWFGDFQMGSDGWVAEDVVCHGEPGTVAESSGEFIRMHSWSATLGGRAEGEGTTWEWSSHWEFGDDRESTSSRAWESTLSWARQNGDDHWRLAGRHRALDVASAAADPALSPWVWRGMADLGHDDELGRMPWRELSLLGLDHAFRVEAGWSRSSMSVQWASTWGSELDGLPLLSVGRVGIEEKLRRDLSLRVDIECIGRSQAGTDSWTLSPFAELMTSPSPGLVVALGLGVDPWVDDPLTRELSERGREEHLRSVAGYGALAELSLPERLERMREAEHDLAGRVRVGLEVIYEFGLRRSPVSGGRR